MKSTNLERCHFYIRSSEKFLSLRKAIMNEQQFLFYIILSNYV